MRAIIVDDELKGRETMEFYLKEYFPDVEILELCPDIHEAKTAIIENDPNVIFLDINMPEGTGFDLFEQVDLSEKFVIFVTAYAEHAVRAFRVDAFDYLLKPIALSELTKVISKIRLELKEKRKPNMRAHRTKIRIKLGKSYKILDVNDILYVESDGNYSNLILADNETHVISKNIKKLEDDLFNFLPFFRIHQSSIVNINHVVEYDTNMVTISNKKKISIAKARLQEFKVAIEVL